MPRKLKLRKPLLPEVRKQNAKVKEQIALTTDPEEKKRIKKQHVKIGVPKYQKPLDVDEYLSNPRVYAATKTLQELARKKGAKAYEKKLEDRQEKISTTKNYD